MSDQKISEGQLPSRFYYPHLSAP